MVNQIDTKLDFAPDTAKHSNSRRPRGETHVDRRTDEIIALLANSYENRRVRQVIEWEHMPRRNYFPKAV